MIDQSMRDPDFLNAIIENVGALVVVLDHEGRIYRFNAACEELSGFTFAEVAGKCPWDIFVVPENAYIVQKEAFETMIASSDISAHQHVNYWLTKSGVYRLIEWNNTLLRDANGRVNFMISIGNDVTERKQMETSLRQSEERMRLVLKATNDGIWDWNPVTGHAYHSTRWKEIIGYLEDELPEDDTSFFNFIHPDDKFVVTQAISAHLENNSPYRVELRLRHKNGSYRWILSRGEAIRDIHGKPIRMVGSITDITDLKEAEENLKALNDELENRVKLRTAELTTARDDAERANRAKSEFLSRMSHELRTPMNAILGFSHVLEYQNLTPKQSRFVHEIHRAGDYLLKLINELLDLARIESGKMTVLLQPINLSDTLKAAIEIIQPAARAKQIHLLNECEEKITVLADPTRLKQILVNLLSNAVKYNIINGSIDVTREYPASNVVRLCVTDTGPGIAHENFAQLFKPFERLGAEFTEVEGTGIGLALCKQLAELMGGVLGFNSALGKGSMFWIELPLIVEMASVPAEIAAQQDKIFASDGQEWLVLYIEDNASNLRVVEAMFQYFPHLKLISATRGEFGLDLARRYQPAVILLDIHLPGIDGYAVLEALKADTAICDIPVIALSADAMTMDIERALDAGFVHYLTKPINMTELSEAIERCLKPIGETIPSDPEVEKN